MRTDSEGRDHGKNGTASGEIGATRLFVLKVKLDGAKSVENDESLYDTVMRWLTKTPDPVRLTGNLSITRERIIGIGTHGSHSNEKRAVRIEYEGRFLFREERRRRTNDELAPLVERRRSGSGHATTAGKSRVTCDEALETLRELIIDLASMSRIMSGTVKIGKRSWDVVAAENISYEETNVGNDKARTHA